TERASDVAQHSFGGLGARAALRSRDLAQGPAVDVLHDERQTQAPEIEHAADRNDVGVIELRHDVRLALEARDRLAIVEVPRANQLDSHRVAGGALFGEVDERRSSTAQLSDDLESGVECSVLGR